MTGAIIYLILLATLSLIFATGLFLGDTDGELMTDTPDQLKRAMRGLQPDVRLWTAFMLLSHAWTNPFVEGLVILKVPNKRARPLGRFLAAIAVVSLLYGFWLLTRG
jgi:hypothetical protein